MKTWLVDTVPLVALNVRNDSQHPWAVEALKHAPATVLTCNAVISEALFLLERGGHSIDSIFAFVERGFLRSDFDFHAHLSRCA